MDFIVIVNLYLEMRQITLSHLNALLSSLLVIIIVYDGRKSYKILKDFQKKIQFVQWNY